MGDARPLFIEGPAGMLEAALREADDPKGAVVLAHPHPLYGGTLHNPVIFHADRELNRVGFTTLRFNFRGVERSDGAHDEGRGEVDDVAAATEWLKALAPKKPMILAGYSFGSRCAIVHAVSNPAIAGVVAIGLPLRIWSFDELPALRRPLAVVQGTQDEFGSIVEIEPLLARLTPPGRLYQVPGATHLFPRQAQEAAALVVEAVNAMLQTLGSDAS
jgi:alpha/beta superfamily hydrolase